MRRLTRILKILPTVQKTTLIVSGIAAVGLLAAIVVLNLVGGACADNLWAGIAFALAFGLIAVSVTLVASQPKWALALIGAGLLLFAFLPVIVSAQSGAPSITLTVDDRVPEVGEEITITWAVSGADSVSVRRAGVQVSTQHTGTRAETIANKRPVEWSIVATNRSGSASRDLTVTPATIGSVRSFITGGNPAGAWVTQIILSLIPATVIIVVAIFRGGIEPGPFIAGGICMPATAFLCAAFGIGNYYLATALLVMIVLAIVGWVMLSD